jgi:hypothetical protein
MHAFAFICLAAAAPSHALLDARRVLRGSRRLDEVFPELVKLVASDAAASDNFGRSVAVDGGTIVIGAHGKDDLTGAAYVRRASDGEELAKLMASDAAAGDKFGYSVAIAGDTVVVGALEAGTGGRVYVFQKSLLGSTYDQVATLAAATAEAGDQFGASVAIASGLTGATIVVGAPGSDGGRGAAHVFQKSMAGGTFELVVTRSADDAAAGDNFGYSVAIDGDTVVVGAHKDDDGGTNSGSVYVFDATDATDVGMIKLTASDAASSDQFGICVDIAGDTVVVGANCDDDGGTNSGSVYVFRTSDGGASYGQVAKLTASDAAGHEYFGKSAAIAGDTVVVGARMDDDGGYDSGSAYVYRPSDDSYDQVAKLTASDAAQNDYFGFSVAIDGGTVVVGAYGDDDGGSTSGSAYVFEDDSSWWDYFSSDAATRRLPRAMILLAAAAAMLAL